MEISIEMPQKNKNRPDDPTMTLLGIRPKECKSIHKRDSCTPMFIDVVFTIAKLQSAEVPNT
jgi:hypothetical protein